MQGELRVRLLLERSAAGAGGQMLAAGAYGVIVRGAGTGGKVQLHLVQRGEVVGELSGGVLQRIPSATPCDLKDAAGQAQQLRAGTGRPAFSDLGFEDDEQFEVRSADGGARLVLETEEQDFMIEAALSATRPPSPD